MRELDRTFAFRAVAGAVRDAATAHAEWNMDPRFEASIAKRAAGTLLARASLAAQSPSDRESASHRAPPHPPGGTGWAARRPAVKRRSPLRRLQVEFSWLAHRAWKAGDRKTHAVWIEALRAVENVMAGRGDHA